MIVPHQARLLHGPYHPPALRFGDRTTCELRGEVVITSVSDARIPWPRCRGVEGTRGGGSGLWLGGDLAKAVRRESAAAVMFWWRASKTAVLGWRKALGVTRTNNEGTRRLIREASQFGADVMKERNWTEAEREEYRKRSTALDLQRHRREGYYQTRAWKPEELLLLGKRSDARVAKKTGRSIEAVRQKRQELGICNPRAREWQPEELRLLDKFSDGAVAARTGRTVWAVYLKRREVRRKRRRQVL
jgi:hypothetical protein